MICDERATARISHAHESKHRHQRDDKVGEGKEKDARPATTPMPQDRRHASECDQRQPFHRSRRIESPTRIDGHKPDRREDLSGIPPHCHSGVSESPAKRSENNLFLTNAAILKPKREQTQHDRDQEEWPGSDHLLMKLLAPTVGGSARSGNLFLET